MKKHIHVSFSFLYILFIFISLIGCSKSPKNCSDYIKELLTNNKFKYIEFGQEDTTLLCQGIRDALDEDSLKYYRQIQIPNFVSSCKYWVLQNHGIQIIEFVGFANILGSQTYYQGFNFIMKKRIKEKIGISLENLLKNQIPNDLVDTKEVFDIFQNRLYWEEKNKVTLLKIDTSNSILEKLFHELNLKIVRIGDSSEIETKINPADLLKGIKIEKSKMDEYYLALLVNVENITYSKFCKTSEQRPIGLDLINQEKKNK
jgi:hypothetical protein